MVRRCDGALRRFGDTEAAIGSRTWTFGPSHWTIAPSCRRPIAPLLGPGLADRVPERADGVAQLVVPEIRRGTHAKDVSTRVDVNASFSHT